MRERVFLVLVGLLACGGLAVGQEEAKPEGGEDATESALSKSMKAEIEWLCSPELQGRKTWSARAKVANHLAAKLDEMGLTPVPGRESMLDDRGGTAQEPETRNVVGWLSAAPAGEGEEPASADYVLLCAGYDGFGPLAGKPGKYCPGADCNASGVAAVLEVVRKLAGRQADAGGFRRALCVVFLDRSVENSSGAYAFLENKPVPLADCKAAILADMLGRSLLDSMKGHLFVFGWEHCAELERICLSEGHPEGGTLSLFESDLHIAEGADRAFAEFKIPHLYVSSGVSLSGGKESDTPAGLESEDLEARAQWLCSLVGQLLQGSEKIAWREKGEPRVQELQSLGLFIRRATQTLSKEFGAPASFVKMCEAQVGMLEATASKGSVTRAQRETHLTLLLPIVKRVLAGNR